jgi:hypothetical protein
MFGFQFPFEYKINHSLSSAKKSDVFISRNQFIFN